MPPWRWLQWATEVLEMQAQLRLSSSYNRICLALVINDHALNESLAGELGEMLKNQGRINWGTRMDAAIGHCKFRDLASERALLDAIEHDGEYLIRFHSSQSLLHRWHVTPSDISQHPEIFPLITSHQETPA
jgi:hypothetical protein